MMQSFLDVMILPEGKRWTWRVPFYGKLCSLVGARTYATPATARRAARKAFRQVCGGNDLP